MSCIKIENQTQERQKLNWHHYALTFFHPSFVYYIAQFFVVNNLPTDWIKQAKAQHVCGLQSMHIVSLDTNLDECLVVKFRKKETIE